MVKMTPLRRRRSGLAQVTEGLGRLDAEVFRAVAHSPSRLLDTTMPALSRAADQSKLWLALAAGMALSGRIEEIEINPLMVDGASIAAVDALVVLKPKASDA